MNIHQLSVSYQAEHDRILVQLNTQAAEVLRLWITRRMAINLFPRLTQLVASEEARKLPLSNQDEMSRNTLMEFKKQESISQADFKTPFKTEARAFPLGPEPLLITVVTLHPAGNGLLRIGFDEKLANTPNPRGFQVTMDPPLLHNFLHLLESSIKASEWGLLHTSKPATADPTLTGEGSPTTPPPQYLN